MAGCFLGRPGRYRYRYGYRYIGTAARATVPISSSHPSLHRTACLLGARRHVHVQCDAFHEKSPGSGKWTSSRTASNGFPLPKAKPCLYSGIFLGEGEEIVPFLLILSGKADVSNLTILGYVPVQTFLNLL